MTTVKNVESLNDHGVILVVLRLGRPRPDRIGVAWLSDRAPRGSNSIGKLPVISRCNESLP